MKWIASLLLMLLLSSSFAETRLWPGNEEVLREDIRQIMIKAGWGPTSLEFDHRLALQNTVRIECTPDSIKLVANSTGFEKTSTIYHGLYKLGFLFPHPRWQISPSWRDAQKQCGKTFLWRPAFKHRGFHFHTLHPNEWVKGFLEGDRQIAEDTIRWLARNRQNALELNVLRKDWKKQVENVNHAYLLAKAFGISRGISNGAALQQQNSWKMIPLTKAISGIGDEKALLRSLRKLQRHLDYDFLSMEFGTSEFTAVKYDRALSWMKITHDELKRQEKRLFAKIHVSTNQVHPHYGNFNFLVRHASKEIGLFPHTVMFYGLYDEKVPMYGNESFDHLLKFIQEEKSEREIWYFPETSYWIGMDVDVPLLLTDYLKVRALDMEKLHHEGIEGHINFTTGHELGYWLFDWALALNTDLDLNFDPLSAIKILGEDPLVWEPIFRFQNKHIKQGQLIAVLSFSNLQDELARNHRIHERNTIKDLSQSEALREDEILRLERALEELPEIQGVRNEELRKMLEVTELRFSHALHVRRALRHSKKSEERRLEVEAAKVIRLEALKTMEELRAKYERYPSAHLFQKNRNYTSYQFGYLWPAYSLHFWKREEEMVKSNKFNPFFMNIYNFWDILF